MASADEDLPFTTVDVPMSRVKFNVNTEYAYLQNFKILQSTFRRSSLPRRIVLTGSPPCFQTSLLATE